jgi:prevent-host-death family protein
MSISATELRANIYKLLDQVIETGVPLEIERNGHVVRLVAEKPQSKWDRLVPRPESVVGDPDDLVHMDWYDEWKP